MFPHLNPDATWSVRNDAGQRIRAIYEAGAKERQKSIVGMSWTGDVRVYSDYHARKTSFTMGCPYAFSMANALIVYRASARNKSAPNRRHYVEQALRIRDALCWGGLCPKYRALVLSERALQEVPA